MAAAPTSQRRRGQGLRVTLALALIAVLLGYGGCEVYRRVAPPTPPVVTVAGLIGSEKQSFFDDPDVAAAFARHGLAVTVSPAGSREIATRDLAPYGFVFPSSSPAAERIQRDRGVATAYAPFSSPMAVATFPDIAAALAGSGAVRPGADGRQVVDVRVLLDLARQGTRWDRLPGNTAYPARKTVLLSTTDPAYSNSAAMYLALASFVANGDAVPDQAAAARVLPDMCGLFADQGYRPRTTAVLFNDYLTTGRGVAPMALVYEAEFEQARRTPNGGVTPENVLLYPAPTVFSRHTLVPLSPDGDRVGRLLDTDPELAELAARHGFRPTRPGPAASGFPPGPNPAEVVDVPSFETLEQMLAAVERGCR